MKPGKQSPMRLTSSLTVTIAPELKNLVDQNAYDQGVPTNEYVAKILADKLKRPDLAKIPRKPMGRPRIGVKQTA